MDAKQTDFSPFQCAKELTLIMLKPEMAEAVIAQIEAKVQADIQKLRAEYGDDIDPKSTTPWGGCTCGHNAYTHMVDDGFNPDGSLPEGIVIGMRDKQATVVVTGLCLALGTLPEREDMRNLPFLIRKTLENAGIEVPEIYRTAQPRNKMDIRSVIAAAMMGMFGGAGGFGAGEGGQMVAEFKLGPNGIERIS